MNHNFLGPIESIEPVSQNEQVLIVLSMGRSGTSLLGSWLESIGLPIGEKLIGGGVANVKGYFEDEAFVNFHNGVLANNGLNYEVGMNQKINITAEEIQQAKELIISKESQNSQWGWKDPRSCLFIPLWRALIPNAKFLVIFRHYSHVVDSHIRRNEKFALQKISHLKGIKGAWRRYRAGKLWKSNLPLEQQKFTDIWARHNHDIVNFLKQTPKADYLVFQLESLSGVIPNIYDHLVNQWGFDLQYEPFEKVYSSNLLKKEAPPIPPSKSLEIAEDVYQTLLTYRSFESPE